jgi:hypothetical protein
MSPGLVILDLFDASNEGLMAARELRAYFLACLGHVHELSNRSSQTRSHGRRRKLVTFKIGTSPEPNLHDSVVARSPRLNGLTE